jgi:hypothetical protein
MRQVRVFNVRRATPYNPQRIGAAHKDACASAPNMTGAAPNIIGAKKSPPAMSPNVRFMRLWGDMKS